MTDPTAPPPDPVTPHVHDRSSAVFRFDTQLWFEAPEYGASDPNDKELIYRREANDNVYRTIGNPTTWNRFTTLAYYALDDGMKFDKEWEKIDTDPTNIHRIIWYNYTYHTDRDMDIVPKLKAWATQISYPYLLIHDSEAIDMNTMRYAYQDLPTNGEEDMDIESESGWTPVPERGNTRNRNRNNGNPQPTNPNNETGISTAPGFNHAPEESTRPTQIQTPPPSNHLATTKVTPSPPPAAENRNINPIQKFSLIKEPQLRPSSHVASSTNDGTHRVTIRWTVPNDKKVEDLESNRTEMDSAILNLTQQLFEDSDGYFYRWESDNLTQRNNISKMTPEVFREYVSPSITCIASRQQIVYGLRVGFTKNPVAWKTKEKREAMDKAQVQLLISNSRCNSGKIVTAGYILLKAANTTHRHRYTQHLREQLPPTTPYFDVVRAVKSPMDQIIPHLAIQCGENHVTTVCQALSNLLTGQKTAIFLPRYAIQTMTDVQMQQHFEFHDKWAKSLEAVSMGPTITHLDQPRLEYFADGTTQTRSTREWVASLTLSDGTTPSLCDAVNGTNDRQAYLVAPRHYLEDAKRQWSEYRTRLSPPRHREARFQDSVPDIPDNIHINTEVQANISFLERMSAAEIWRQAPAAIRDDKEAPAKAQKLPPPPRGNNQHNNGRQHNNDKRNKVNNGTITEGTAETNQHTSSRASISSSIASDDDQSTDSTQELTRASQNTYQARFHEHAQMFKRQQAAIESLGKTSSDRLSLIERQLHRFEDFDTKLSAVGTQMEQVSNNQKALTDSLRAIKKDNQTEKTNTREFQDQSDQKIDALSQTVVDAMAAILAMGAQFNTISEQVFKISGQLEQPAAAGYHSDQSEGSNMEECVRTESRNETDHHHGAREQSNANKHSDASLSSTSTKNSADTATSRTSTYTHKSPVKKKRHRSHSRSMHPTRASTALSGHMDDESPDNLADGRNLDYSFQQQQDRAPLQLQDTMEDETGEAKAESTDSRDQQHEGDDEDGIEEEEGFSEEEDEFMTPPSSPAQPENIPMADRTQHAYTRKNDAPPNSQYNENTGSAGAPTT